MNKKGELILGTIILAGLLIAGMTAISSYEIVSENRYVGDSTTSLYYDLKYCKIGYIEKDNLVSFKTKRMAENEGFNPASCVPQKD